MKTKTNNRLWRARQRTGLEQKQVARLLGHKNCDQISRYERGVRMPNLRTALKLELIYSVPVSSLFPDHYQKIRAEIAAVSAGSQLASFGQSQEERLPDAHVCTYRNLLLQKKPSASEIDAARDHTVTLVRDVGEVLNRYKPPE